MRLLKSPLLAAALLAVLIAIVALAQKPVRPLAKPTPQDGRMHLWSKVGSFTLEGTGHVEMTFTGTLLLNNFKGQANVTGAVRKEFEGMGRRAWFGTGKAVLDGNFRRILWFGKNVDCVWTGKGNAMVYGEYDQKQETGFVQVDKVPTWPWLTTGRQFFVPATDTPGYQEMKKNQGKPAPGNGSPKPLKVG